MGLGQKRQVTVIPGTSGLSTSQRQLTTSLPRSCVEDSEAENGLNPVISALHG